MNYREEWDKSKEYKRAYIDGIERVIEKRQKEAADARQEYGKRLFKEPDKCREDFKRLLGWPLTEGACPPPAVTSTHLSDEEDYTVYRLGFEILDGLTMTGLYFERKGEERVPLVLVQHGGLGTPELISGAYGSTSNYNDMLQRVLSRGVDVFAPQLLLWDKKYDVPFDRTLIDARLKRLGGSVTALELYGLRRMLDYFEQKGRATRFGMVGLSYGGFYTLFLSAVDTRISSAISCAYFNTRDRFPWCDWTWTGAAHTFDDAQIAALVYPRRLCLEIATRDELFDVKGGEESYRALLALCRDVGTDWVSLMPFDGTHEFCKDDAPIDTLIADLKK